MIISYKLLVSICKDIKKIPLEQILNAFNCVGIEVESCRKHPKNSGLKIVKIKSISKHPNSDKLHLVQIEDLNQNEYSVVCGASNLLLNHYAIYAPIGAIIKDNIEIKPKEIRSVMSQGMLCGYEELTNINLDLLDKKDKEGIILFKPEDLVSTDPIELLNLNDIVLDLSVPSNRNDLNSYYGIINEISPIININFKLDYELENLNNNQNITKLVIDKNYCNDIGLLVVKNLPKFNTTWKQKEILLAHGFKIQNNWLDFLNIITLICNNPIHIYDLDKISNNHQLNIEVKPLQNKEKIIALDGNEYQLDNEIIGIFNNNDLINIAGIIGLDKFKYETSSKNVLIEVANFNYLAIRKMSTNLKISTKASLLFSKPIASWITVNTFLQIYDYFSSLNYPIFAYTNFSLIKTQSIKFDYEAFRKFIGINIEDFEIQKWLKKLNMKLIDNNIIKFHPARLDLINQYDLFEELLKLMDINNLKPQKIIFDLKKYQDITFDNELWIRNYLINNGLFEVKTYNLISKENLYKFNFFNHSSNNEVKIANPISLLHEYYRFNTIDSLLKTIKYNLDRKREINSIFEIQSLLNNASYVRNLSILFIADLNQKIINYSFSWDLISIKSFVKNLLSNFIDKITFNISSNSIKEVYERQQIEILHDHKLIGYIGMIKSRVLREYNINTPCFCLTINLDKIINNPKSNYEIKAISPFPVVTRDINIEIDISKNININEIIKQLLSITNIQACKVVDFFLKDNKHIYTCELKIVSYEKTLTNDEINNIINHVNSSINKLLSKN